MARSDAVVGCTKRQKAGLCATDGGSGKDNDDTRAVILKAETSHTHGGRGGDWSLLCAASRMLTVTIKHNTLADCKLRRQAETRI